MPDPLQLTPHEAEILIAAIDYGIGSAEALQELLTGLAGHLEIQHAPRAPHPEAWEIVRNLRDRLEHGVRAHAAGGTDDIDTRGDHRTPCPAEGCPGLEWHNGKPFGCGHPTKTAVECEGRRDLMYTVNDCFVHGRFEGGWCPLCNVTRR